MKFYLQATAICEDCGHSYPVLLGHEKVLWHECNQGNVFCKVPKELGVKK